MQNSNRTKVVFKDYSPNQILLLPPSLEDMIDPNHPVRLVNQVIESLDIDLLINKYKGGGCLEKPVPMTTFRRNKLTIHCGVKSLMFR
jgi:transposase